MITQYIFLTRPSNTSWCTTMMSASSRIMCQWAPFIPFLDSFYRLHLGMQQSSELFVILPSFQCQQTPLLPPRTPTSQLLPLLGERIHMQECRNVTFLLIPWLVQWWILNLTMTCWLLLQTAVVSSFRSMEFASNDCYIPQQYSIPSPAISAWNFEEQITLVPSLFARCCKAESSFLKSSCCDKMCFKESDKSLTAE
jgi:hypothetical protein